MVFAIIILVLLIVGIAVVLVNREMLRMTAAYILPAGKLSRSEKADCVLVLGCGVLSDGTPTHMLYDRVSVGISAWEAGASDKLLMSGDHGRTDYNEVAAMKQQAMEAGIDADAIFCDHAGFSTYESLYRARDIFGVKKVIIVTQRYHLYRALFIARQLGLEAYGIPADLRPYSGQIYREIREMAARCKDMVYCLVEPAPKYLGEEIPITGKGSETDG